MSGTVFPVLGIPRGHPALALPAFVRSDGHTLRQRADDGAARQPDDGRRHLETHSQAEGKGAYC
jgi:hypothetical protein